MTAIRSIEIVQHRLSPMEAEVRIVVAGDGLSGAELRGRIHGPNCPGTDTIQIAYPLRIVSVTDETWTARAIIPEPNLWSPETPFTYEVLVEVWRDEQRVVVETRTFGLSQGPRHLVTE